MSVVGLCVDEPLFPSDLMLDFVYTMIVLIYDHKKKLTQRGKGGRGYDNSDKLFL